MKPKILTLPFTEKCLLSLESMIYIIFTGFFFTLCCVWLLEKYKLHCILNHFILLLKELLEGVASVCPRAGTRPPQFFFISTPQCCPVSKGRGGEGQGRQWLFSWVSSI